MPNDAKFGLIVGVALVLASAVLFFQKEEGPAGAGPAAASTAAPPAQPPTTPSAAAMLPSPPPLPRPNTRPVPGRTTSRIEEASEEGNGVTR